MLPKRFTLHALYIYIYILIHRIQGYAEVKGARLSLTLLVRETAFDKVRHDKLIFALKKIGFNQHSCDVLQDCYKEPTFYVTDAIGTSDIKRQSSGIRQGCPLSPRLWSLSCLASVLRSAPRPADGYATEESQTLTSM